MATLHGEPGLMLEQQEIGNISLQILACMENM